MIEVVHGHVRLFDCSSISEIFLIHVSSSLQVSFVAMILSMNTCLLAYIADKQLWLFPSSCLVRVSVWWHA